MEKLMGHPLLGLVGRPGAGKDTFAQTLVDRHGWTRLSFADRLRDVLYATNPIVDARGPNAGYERVADLVDAVGWDRAKRRPEVRRLLQRLGLAARQNIDVGVWVEPTLSDILDVRGPVVLTDVRFENEADLVPGGRPLGGALCLVRRPILYGPSQHRMPQHESEELARRSTDWFDLVIDNDGSLSDLAVKADAVHERLMEGAKA